MIGLVGCGRWGSKILRDLRSIGCEVGVVARSTESVERARLGGADMIWSTVSKMEDVDGIVVATPTSTHLDVIAEVIDRDVPVFTEKPIGPDPAGVRALVDRVPDRLFVMDKWRYHKGVEEIRNLDRSAEFGPLNRLHVTFTSWSRPHPDVDAAWVLLPHVLAIMLELTGRVPFVDSVSGWRAPGSGDAEVLALLGSEARWVAEISTLRPDYRRVVRAQFSDATVVLGDGYDDHLTVLHHGRPADEASIISFEHSMPLEDELRAFVAHIGGGPPPRSSAGEGLEIVERVDQIRRAAGWEAV